MRKIFKIKNLGWTIAGILFLILVFKILQNRNQRKVVKENINPIERLKLAVTTPIVKQEQELVEVVKVIDGDTVIVKINGKEESIRLVGIDTPEKNECFEKEATKRAKELMENKKIKLEADSSQDNKDKYDRLLRYVYLEDGTLVNKKLVEEGFGMEYTYKIDYKFQTEFKKVEKMAKEKKIGMWADGVCENF
ncbi:MAG: thermonuclease family protein [Candidatus Shapirobacteria bacterium]|nr:thermonuclease family protein [Candidatus Shapirobacteria bacterium]MDD4383016.1 thermonuclease family protein [Candidatus Shapirobacteria bacterium]